MADLASPTSRFAPTARLATPVSRFAPTASLYAPPAQPTAATPAPETSFWRDVGDLGRAAGQQALEFGGSSLRGLHDLAQSVSNVAAPLGEAAGLDTEFIPREDSWFYQGGEWLSGIAGDIGVPPERETVGTDIVGGVGQLVTQIGAYLTRPIVGMGTLFGVGADTQAQRADEVGATGPERDTAILAGSAITAITEAIGTEALLRRLMPNVGNRIVDYLADIGIAAGGEAFQEATEQLAQDLLTRATTNPDQEILEDVQRQLIAAGGAAGIVRGLLTLALPRLRQRASDAQPEPPPEPTDEPASPDGPAAPTPTFNPGDSVSGTQAGVTVSGTVIDTRTVGSTPMVDVATGQIDETGAPEIYSFPANRVQPVAAGVPPIAAAAAPVAGTDAPPVAPASQPTVPVSPSEPAPTVAAPAEPQAPGQYQAQVVAPAQGTPAEQRQVVQAVRAATAKLGIETRKPTMTTLVALNPSPEVDLQLQALLAAEIEKRFPSTPQTPAPASAAKPVIPATPTLPPTAVQKAASPKTWATADGTRVDASNPLARSVFGLAKKAGVDPSKFDSLKDVLTAVQAARVAPPAEPAKAAKPAKPGMPIPEPPVAKDTIRLYQMGGNRFALDPSLAEWAAGESALTDGISYVDVPLTVAGASRIRLKAPDKIATVRNPDTEFLLADEYASKAQPASWRALPTPPPAKKDTPRKARTRAKPTPATKRAAQQMTDPERTAAAEPAADSDIGVPPGDPAYATTKRAKELGIDVDPDWSLGRLKREVAAAEKDKPAAARKKTPPPATQRDPTDAEIIDAVRAELNRRGLKRIAVKVQPAMDSDKTAHAAYWRGAVYLFRHPDKPLSEYTSDARHEMLHAFKRLGVITDKEWQVLRRQSQTRWRRRFNIEALYRAELEKANPKATPAQIEALLDEEGVAEALRAYLDGRETAQGIIKRILEKIRAFLEAISNAYRGLGLRSSQGILYDMETGRIIDRLPDLPDAAYSDSDLPLMHRVYHGSGSKHLAFSLQKIGTGEGSQAFGWGLYFADRRGVAEYYKKLNNDRVTSVTYDGESLYKLAKNDHRSPELGVIRDLVQDIITFHKTPTEAILSALQVKQSYMASADRLNSDYLPKQVAFLQSLDPQKFKVVKGEGHLYQVDLAPSVDDYLNWDARLGEQSPHVLEQIKRIVSEAQTRTEDTGPVIDPTMTGEQFYNALSQKLDGSDMAASMELLKAGVPGIRFLDRDSRRVGEGTHNYVIFDEALITIEMVNDQTMDQTPDQPMFARRPKLTGLSLSERRDYEQVIQTENLLTMAQTVRYRANWLRRFGVRWLVKNAADKNLYSAELEKSLNQGKLLEGSASAYKMLAMARNLHGPIGGMIIREMPGSIQFDMTKGMVTARTGNITITSMDGTTKDIELKPLERGMEVVSKHGPAMMNKWKMWAIAKRFEWALADGRGKWVDDPGGPFVHPTNARRTGWYAMGNFDSHDEQQAWIDRWKDVDQANLVDGQNVFMEAHDNWIALQKSALDFAEVTGLIDQSQRQQWERSDYMPLYRVIENSVLAPFSKDQISNQRSGIFRLQGSQAIISDPLENMVLNISHLVAAGMRTEAMNRLYDQAKQAGIIRDVTAPMRKMMVAASSVASELRKYGINVDALSKATDPITGSPTDLTGSFIEATVLTGQSKDPTIQSMMVNGKVHWLQVSEPELLEVIVNMRPRERNFLWRLLGWTKGVLTKGVTITPAFMARNVIRDTLSTNVITGIPNAFGLKVMGNVARNLRMDPELLALSIAGGLPIGFYEGGPIAVRNRIERMGRKTRAYTPQALWRSWQHFGAAYENANRLLIYEHYKRQGREAEGAFQALDILDFSSHGSNRFVQDLIFITPFLNARIQGLYRLGRGVKENPMRFLIRGGVLTMLTLLLGQINDDDDRYEELEQWEKDTYWHVWLDKIFPADMLRGMGIPTDTSISIPLPFEVGAIMATIPNRLMRLAKGNDSWRITRDSMISMITGTFAVDMPQGIKPIIEQVANRIFFLDRPIVSESLERLDPAAQYTTRTSGTARLISEVAPDWMGAWVNSPVRIEHMIRGYLGGSGSLLLAAADVFTEPLMDLPPEPTRRPYEFIIPVVDSFLSSGEPYSTRYMTDFYALRSEIERMHLTVEAYKRSGNPAAARRAVEENRELLAQRNRVDQIYDRLSAINRRIRQIEQSRTLSGDEKRRLLDNLLQQRNSAAARVSPILADLGM